MNQLRCFALIGVFWHVAAAAQQPFPVSAARLADISADIRLSRVADDTWRADYVFSAPVSALTMDAAGDFRRDAWTILSPGIVLANDAATNTDVVSMGGRPFQRFSVEIKSYDVAIPKAYIAVDRFSDGGRLFYLGFLGGAVASGAGSRPLTTHIVLAGRPGETALAPPQPRTGAPGAYAYFGARQPTPAGAASAIFDPAVPAWVKEAMLDTTARISRYYGQAYGRVPTPPLVMMVTMGDRSAPGLSMKGGAVGSQIAYRLGGEQFLADHPAKRAYIAQQVAHEMAHVWQQQVARGGVGEEAPWVHEGGAEAMAHDALLKTQVWTAADGAAFVARSLKRCTDEGGSFDSYDGIYACGFRQFHATGLDTAQLWRTMMRLTEQTGEPYSPHMVEHAGKEVRQGAASTQPRAD
ncbi:hypothetical protein [Massilia sp.]|uniref:hypothetical protein n=1 Tax=Massilia sp. TaxID=1882437 RepID=UPI0039192C13